MGGSRESEVVKGLFGGWSLAKCWELCGRADHLTGRFGSYGEIEDDIVTTGVLPIVSKQGHEPSTASPVEVFYLLPSSSLV